MKNFYTQNSAGFPVHGQTMIVDQETGKTVALVYDGAAHAGALVEAYNAYDTLRAENERLREALRECAPHVEHADGCGYKRPDSCIACGALALLKGGAE